MSEKIKIASVIGARPQFIKAAPVEFAMKASGAIEHFSIHTGQHYDASMSQIFFDELGLEKPYVNLHAGSGSHAAQTAAIMLGLEPVLMELQPDLVLVYGDTNSTIAAALVATKLHIKVAHVEAGLRSFNREMPEEINRILTDHASDILFAPTDLAFGNLEKEGLGDKVIRCGDVMMDMANLALSTLKDLEVEELKYYYATIHRPYNTDQKERLELLLSVFNKLDAPVVFSIHPRTRNKMQNHYGMDENMYPNIQFIEPQGYFENLRYIKNASGLITDSGGMQKEAFFLKKRCITVRSETEWIETLNNNCNMLVWENVEDLPAILKQSYGPFAEGVYGDGKASVTIVKHLLNYIKENKI